LQINLTVPLKIYSQNCQSLNVSTRNKKTSQKLIALCKLDADIILFSDIRLNSLVQTSALNDITKKLDFNGYNFYHNSPFSSRGVAIAIKKCMNPGVAEQKTDRIGNILALKLVNNLVIVAIYGPNDNSREFYVNLNDILTSLNGSYVLVGGDWNSTWDSSPVDRNIDTFFMANLPSKERSERVKILADQFDLTDPYRYVYTNRRDYTYIPNAVANNNRSRIDFFLISKSLTNKIVDTGISPSKISTVFDHKSIFLTIGNRLAERDRNKICNSVIDDKTVELIVALTVKEFYLNNADPEAVPRFTVNTLRFEIGRIHSKLKTATDLELNLLKTNNITQADRDLLKNILNEAEDIAETLPGLEFFENLPTNCDPDIFFEGLVLSVENEVLSKQAAIYKTRNLRKKLLTEKLALLKNNFLENSAEIYRTERLLDNLVEEELRKELERYKKFERLNNEKITPYFMGLVKNEYKKPASLNDICDDNGNAFQNAAQQHEYISGFYSTLYEKQNTVPLNDDSVAAFLGPVATEPGVLNSKLTDGEKEALEQDITMEEFDTAANQIKTGSSPGLDGISNKFIKKFWQLFRTPLFKYTKWCLDRGSLTESFRTAKVRLIPKKTDPKKISNWRPISLLNCFYKLVSRVLTNRIRKFSDKITAIGQKGYSTTKCCQEVVITLLDAIHELKKSGKKGCIISLDISKAFDSLSHDFMCKALKFFNFGDRFISWIKTICTNRTASIILDTGKLSRPIKLGRGNAQGDVISPFIFNICYQILLMKLECELQIEKVDLPEHDIADPDLLRANLTGAELPVSHISKKTFAFADDCNILCALKKSSIISVLNILSEFENISGLKCNVEKTNIIFIGSDPVDIENIAELGLNIVENITVLGFTINNGPSVFEENFNIILNKCLNQLRFWTRFNLSLPGRINICKSMFYSQLSYIGCVIPINNDQYSQIEDIIYRYASGNLRIAKNRVFLPVNQGGLGLFPITDFLSAQKISWIRRCKKIDTVWKTILIRTGDYNIYKITHKNIDKTFFPVLFEIAKAFSDFTKKFTGRNNNFKKAYLLNNEALTAGLRVREILCVRDILDDPTPIPERVINNLKNLKMSDLFEGNTFVTKINFQRHFTSQIGRQLWDKLDKIRRAAVTRYGGDPYKKSDSLENFFQTWKSCSKKIRIILGETNMCYVPHNMIKFADNTEIIIGEQLAKHKNSLWNRSYFSNDMRTFIFKMHNNTLPFNTILSHFVRGIDRNCSFCDLTFNQIEEDETILHLFYNCNVSETMRENFFKWITNDQAFSTTRREFFGQFLKSNNFLNELLNFSLLLLMKFLWDCKVRKCLPNFALLKSFFGEEITTMRLVSKKFSQILTGSGLDYNRWNNTGNIINF
jgi:exonuclease III